MYAYTVLGHIPYSLCRELLSYFNYTYFCLQVTRQYECWVSFRRVQIVVHTVAGCVVTDYLSLSLFVHQLSRYEEFFYLYMVIYVIHKCSNVVVCVCVCARVRACVRACVSACVRVCVCERERERESVIFHERW